MTLDILYTILTIVLILGIIIGLMHIIKLQEKMNELDQIFSQHFSLYSKNEAYRTDQIQNMEQGLTDVMQENINDSTRITKLEQLFKQ